MSNVVTMYNNMMWNLLDDGSKLTVVDILMSKGIIGECKVVIRQYEEGTKLVILDNTGSDVILLPFDIFSLLNE